MFPVYKCTPKERKNNITDNSDSHDLKCLGRITVEIKPKTLQVGFKKRMIGTISVTKQGGYLF